MQDLMLDLETLSTANNAVVASIGLVAFELATGDIGETLYLELALEEQVIRGLHHDQATIDWWATQPFSFHHTKTQLPVELALGSITAFMQANGTANVWGNGADFDNVILRSLYDAYGQKAPWSYSGNRCYRTLRNILPSMIVDRVGDKHHALNDALTQACHLNKLYHQPAADGLRLATIYSNYKLARAELASEDRL